MLERAKEIEIEREETREILSKQKRERIVIIAAIVEALRERKEGKN